VAALQFMSPDFQLPNILYEHITHRTNLKMWLVIVFNCLWLI
jgi:hypothetical protein